MLLKKISLLTILFCAYSFSSVQEIIDQAESCFAQLEVLARCIKDSSCIKNDVLWDSNLGIADLLRLEQGTILKINLYKLIIENEAPWSEETRAKLVFIYRKSRELFPWHNHVDYDKLYKWNDNIVRMLGINR